jgi:hypothetical protein
MVLNEFNYKIKIKKKDFEIYVKIGLINLIYLIFVFDRVCNFFL